MSAAALTDADTLVFVGEPKRIDPALTTHLASIVRRVVDEDFGGRQRQAEKGLGISQSHISQLLRGGAGDRGPGLAVLLRLREYTQLSIDELLGLPPLRPRSPPSAGDEISLADRVERLERRLDALAGARDSTST